MTKTELLAAYRAILPTMYDWAMDQAKLDRFMQSVERTIRTQATTWDFNSLAIARAWRSLGGKGKPTLKAMRALGD